MFRPLIVLFLSIFLATPALAASVHVTVDISRQSMTVKVGGETMYNWDVSTGKRGYRTPTGTYHPVRMYREYYSKKYDNAPMPNSIFFRGGFAIHGTGHVSQLGAPASHGCVRLSKAHAALLYELVRQHGTGNTTIKIVQ